MTVKRFLILFCLSALAVAVCRPLFFSREVLLSFDAKVSGKSAFRVAFFGKGVRENEPVRELEPDTAFRKISYILPVDKLTGVKLYLTPEAGNFEIKNIVLSGKTEISVPSSKLRVFVENIGAFSLKGGIVSGKAADGATLTLFLNAPQKGRVHFVFPVFFTLCVLWFLTFDKLLPPLLNLFQKGYARAASCPNRIDGIFLAVFLIALILPVSNVDFDSEISRENRRLAAPAKLFVDGRVNNAFGRQFDEWFKDRFAGRDKVIDLYNAFQNAVNKKFERHGVIIGKNDWMFHGRIANFKGTDTFSDAELEKMRDNVLRLKRFCDDHGIRLYIIVSPYKHHVYPELYPEEVKRSSDVGRMDRIEQYFIREMPEVDFLYLKNALLNEKKKTDEWLYFKTDHHWTDRGAYAAYRALTERIAKDFPSVKPVSLSDYRRTTGRKVRAECDRAFTVGTQYASLNYNDESVFDLDFAFYDHKRPSELKIDDQCRPKSFAHNENGAPYKVFYITDSQGENFINFLGHTFKDIQKRRYNAEIRERRKNENIYMPFYESDILEYKPDILILHTYDAYIPSLMSLYED